MGFFPGIDTIDPMERTAKISSCETYRYLLSRKWSYAPQATFIMLNPSTADGRLNDPTVKKCIGFARRWGMGGLMIVNLFAYRDSKPEKMLQADDPVGPDNASSISWACERAAENEGLVICAWGANGRYMDQDETVVGWLEMLTIKPKCLRLTQGGAPEHPLFVPYETTPIPYNGRKK